MRTLSRRPSFRFVRPVSLAVLAAVVTLASCGGGDSPAADSTASPAVAATAAPDSARLAAVRDSLARDSVTRDSIARADSLRPRLRYRAVGQEPGWLLVIDDTVLTLRWNYDERRATVPTPPTQPIAGGRQWTHRDSTLTFTITARDTACADAMSGRPYPARVQVRIGRNTLLDGCGGDPTRALHGAEWRVDSLNGAAVDTAARVSITFGDDDRAFGLTGCNNYSATYQLRGDTVIFAPAVVTRRACTPPRDGLERSMLALLADTVVTAIAPDGRLRIKGTAGRGLTARR